MKTRVFCGLASHEVTCEKKKFVGSLYSRNSRKTIARVSVRNFVFSFFALPIFVRKAYSRASCKNASEGVFDEKHEKCNLNKNSNHESIKTLSKTYKIHKNIFEFDRQVIEYIHHIWTCKITQMK